MKSRRYAYHVPALFFMMTLFVAVFSWMANIYEVGDVENMLSAEGIRWGLSHVIEGYVCNPALGVSLVLLIGLGVFVYSGACGAIERVCSKGQWISRKERRALMAALLVLVVYMLLIFLCMFIPSTISRSVTGNLGDSPLCKGWCYVVSLGIGLSGAAYGYVSETFRGDVDLVKAMSGLISSNADYWVSLFFIIHFFSTVEYTRLGEWVGMTSQILYALCQFVCYFLLAMILVFRYRSFVNEK